METVAISVATLRTKYAKAIKRQSLTFHRRGVPNRHQIMVAWVDLLWLLRMAEQAEAIGR